MDATSGEIGRGDSCQAWRVDVKAMLMGMLGAIAAAGLIATGPGCSGQASPDTMEEITIHLDKCSLLYLPIYFAIDQHYFANEGLKVEIEYYGDAACISTAVESTSGSIVAAHPLDVSSTSRLVGEISVIGQVVEHVPMHVLGPIGDVPSTNRLRVPVDEGEYRHYKSWVLGNGEGSEGAPQVEGYESLANIDWRKLSDEILVVGEPASAASVLRGAQIRRSAAWDLSPHCYRVLAMDATKLGGREDDIRKVLRALQQAMTTMHADPIRAIETASARFPEIGKEVLEAAVERMLAEQICPGSVLLRNEAWVNTLAVSPIDEKEPSNIRLDSTRLRMNE